MIKIHKLVFISFVLLIIIGCNNLKIKDINKKLPFNIKGNFQNNISTKNSNPTLINWYKDFNDDNLNKIIDNILKNNLDLKIAIKRIKQARYEQLKTRSNLFPTFDLSGDFNRKKQSYKLKDIFGKDIYVSNTSNTFSFQLMASYEIDLWKKLSFERKYSSIELLKVNQNREIVLESIVSEACKLYFELCTTNLKIKYLKKKCNILKKLYETYNKRFQSGLIDYFQLNHYYNLLIDNNIELKNSLRQKKYIEQNLNVLMGHYPEDNNINPSIIEINVKKLSPPSMLPSQLIKRRPDIRLAMLDVKSKLASLGYARALRFPSINLSANFGYLSDKIRELTYPESQIWGISSSILYPLFNARKLKYNQKKYEESLKESILNYQKTVLNAFFEVESTLIKRKTLERIYNYLKKQLKIKQREFFLEQKKYDKGLCSITDIYEKELNFINKKIEILNTKLSIIENQILLYKVLGGTIDHTFLENIE